MRNTLGDLNNHLFATLERLNDEDIKGEDLQEEITRARAISDVASKIISNGSLILEAKKVQSETLGRENTEIPKMLEG